MAFFKSKSGKSSRKHSLKEDKTNNTQDVHNTNSDKINTQNTTYKPIISDESLVEESNELSNTLEENIDKNSKDVNTNRNSTFNSLTVTNVDSNETMNYSLGHNSRPFENGVEIYKEIIEDSNIKNVPSATSIDTNVSRNTNKTQGTVTFTSKSSINENEETSKNQSQNHMGHHKRNSIFSSFSKMRRKSKASIEEKKYKSAPYVIIIIF